MTPEAFCYWLQGALELADVKEFSPEEVKIIKDHLKLVFEKLTPDRAVNILAPPVTRPLDLGVPSIPQQLPIVRDGTGGYPNGYDITISC